MIFFTIEDGVLSEDSLRIFITLRLPNAMGFSSGLITSVMPSVSITKAPVGEAISCVVNVKSAAILVEPTDLRSPLVSVASNPSTLKIDDFAPANSSLCSFR